jgi:transcriptional regulator
MDEAEVTAAMEELIERFEPSYRVQWQGLPQRYREGMMRGIVMFRMRVERFEGKFKLSQNKSAGERERIASWLLGGDEGDGVRRGVGEMMREEG